MKTIKKIRNKIGIEIKAGFWYTVGNFFLKGVAFITIPIFTRLLTPSDYGMISLFSTWVGVFTIIVGMSLNSSVIRGYHDFKDDYDKYLSSTMFLSLISFFAVVLFATVFRRSLTSMIGFSFSIIILILVNSYFSFIINFNNMKYICQYMYKKSLLISIGKTISGIALSIVLINLISDNKYLGRIYGTFIPTVIIGIIIFIIIQFKGKQIINYKYWKYALVLSLPMIPHVLSHLILGQSDRILINKFIGSEAVGIYSFAYNIGIIAQVILGSMNNAWVPWFYKKMGENDNATIVTKSKMYLLTFVFMIIGLIFISPELVKFMAPINYREAMWIIPIVVISYFFQFLYTLLVNVQFYLKKNFFIPIGTVIAGLMNIGLNIYYIPLYGYAAAVYTTLVSYIILFIMHYLVTRYLLKSDIYKFSFFVKPIILMLASAILFYICADLLVIRYSVIVLMIIIMLLRYKTKIIEFIS